MKKIMLINPSVRDKVWAGIPSMCSRDVFLFPPLGLMYIQSYLSDATDHEAEIVDALADDLDYPALENRIRDFAPDIVGITAVTHNLVSVARTAETVKNVSPGILVCLGGPHVHSYPEESARMRHVDVAVPGDGEKVFADLVDAVDAGRDLASVRGIIFASRNGELVRTPDADEIADLDSLPFPDRGRNDFRKYYTPATETGSITTMITGRGCPQRCSFCNTYRDYRSRSAAGVVDEIEECVRLGVQEIFFIDDTFNVTVKRVTDIAEEILRRGIRVKWGFKARCDRVTGEMLALLRRAGCTKIHYGVETGSDAGLRKLNKKISIRQIRETFALTRRHGIRTIGFFMLGCPHETRREDVLQTIEFSRELAADYAVFAIFSPYPDTSDYRAGVERGVIPGGRWESFIRDPRPGRELPTCWEEHFSKEELVGLLKRAHRRFYYRPGIVWKNLTGFHSLAELKRTVKGGLALLRLELLRARERKI